MRSKEIIVRQEEILQPNSRVECWVGTSHPRHSTRLGEEVPDGMVLECMAEEPLEPMPSFAGRAVKLSQVEVAALRLRSEGR